MPPKRLSKTSTCLAGNLLFLFFTCFASGALATDIAGWVEKAEVLPEKLLFYAKMDTGAKTSSLNASHITVFEKNSIKWVRFDVEDCFGNKMTLEKPWVRESVIKRHFGRKHQRPTVTLSLCVGKVLRNVEVNLTDRSGLTCSMLIGRSFLDGNYWIDSSRKLLTEPDCQQPGGPIE